MSQAIGEVVREEGHKRGDGADQWTHRTVVEEHPSLQEYQFEEDQNVAPKHPNSIRHKHTYTEANYDS